MMIEQDEAFYFLVRTCLEQAYTTCDESRGTLDCAGLKADAYRLCIRTRKMIEPLLVELDKVLPPSTTVRPGWPETRDEP